MNETAVLRPRHLTLVLLASFLLMAILFIINTQVHRVPWGLESDGLFLVGTASEKMTLQHRPVGYPLLLKSGAAVLGSAFRAGQLFSAVFGAAFLTLCYLLVFRLFASESIALCATGAMLVFPRFLISSMLCTTDLTYGFLGLAALLLLSDGEPSSPHHPRLVGACTGLAFLTTVPGLFLFLGIFFAVLIVSRFRRSTGIWLLQYGLTFLVVILGGQLLARLFPSETLGASSGFRIGDFRMLYDIIMTLLIIPPSTAAAGGELADMLRQWPSILFRIAATAMEWLVDFAVLLTPLPFLALGMELKAKARPVFRICCSAFFLSTPLFFYSSFRSVDSPRYFLPFAPLLLGSLFAASLRLIADLPSTRRPLGRLLALGMLSLTIATLTLKTITPFLLEPRFLDWQTQGLRPHPKPEMLQATIREVRARFGDETIFAANNPAFGLFDGKFIYYNWFYEGTSIPLYGQADKDAKYYRDNLRDFFRQTKTTVFVYDSTDIILRLQFQATEPVKNGGSARQLPAYLEAAGAVGPFEIYRVNLEKCAATDSSLEDPRLQPLSQPSGPPPRPGEQPPPPPGQPLPPDAL